MLTSIFLSLLLSNAANPAPFVTGLQQVALQEELNILVYGVLQFSQALHDLYDSTAQKLDRIRKRMDLFQEDLRVLHQQTQSIQLNHNEIRGILKRLKAKNTVLKQQAQAKKEELHKLLVGHRDLVKQITVLEERLASMEQQGLQSKEGEVASLKAHVQQQNLTLWFLLGATRHQQEQMAQQAEKLSKIEEQTRKEEEDIPWGGQDRVNSCT